MTSPTAEESRALLERINAGGSAGRNGIPLVKHLRAALNREAEALAMAHKAEGDRKQGHFDYHILMQRYDELLAVTKLALSDRDAALIAANALRSKLTPDNIAQIIRIADGKHDMGASALGEVICSALLMEASQ